MLIANFNIIELNKLKLLYNLKYKEGKMGEFIRLTGMVIVMLLWVFFMAMGEGMKNLLFKWRYKWIF